MNKISVTIITKNEENNIERCLKSLNWADEIIVVDSGSEDKTLEICKKYNCKVIETKWLGFGKTKKLAVNSAKHDWIFSIDADEEVTENLESEIKTIIKNPKFDGYKVKRKSFYLGKLIEHSGWDRDYPLRLFNRNFGNFNDKKIHEKVVINSKVHQIESFLLHYTYPTIDSHLNKINLYTNIQAEDLKIRKKKYSIVTSLFFGINRFVKMYLLQRGFLDGKEGLILCALSAFGVSLKYIKLNELNAKHD